jgi:quercetin dioxygenase-like cupin family protein
MSAEAYAEVQLENEHFKVTKWTIEPGAEIPMHRHEYDYVVVPLVNETMHVTNADGSEFAAELTAGQSYTRTAGAEHRIENRAGGQDVVFVEIEKLS